MHEIINASYIHIIYVINIHIYMFSSKTCICHVNIILYAYKALCNG